MKSFSLMAAGVIALGSASSPALASSPRTFVSGTGSDSGGCGLAAPCRTFAYAIQQTSASGEIIILSSAGYGAVNITKSVSIINTSDFAGVTVTSGNGITINGNNVSGYFHFQPQGISGTGEMTGEKYQATGVTQESFKNSFQNGQANSTYVNNFRIIGQGPGNNFLVHETLHFTINAKGAVTVFHDNFSVACK